MQVKISHVGIFSAFKLGCFIAALPIVIIAVAFAIVVAADAQKPNALIGLPLALSIPSIAIYALLADFLCGVLAASQAILFNIGAHFFGGLAIHLDRAAWKKVQIGTPVVPVAATPPMPPINPSYAANPMPLSIPSTPQVISIASMPPTQPIAPAPTNTPSKANLPPYVSPIQPDPGMPPPSDGKDKMAAHDEVAVLKRQVEARMKRMKKLTAPSTNGHDRRHRWSDPNARRTLPGAGRD